MMDDLDDIGNKSVTSNFTVNRMDEADTQPEDQIDDSLPEDSPAVQPRNEDDDINGKLSHELSSSVTLHPRPSRAADVKSTDSRNHPSEPALDPFSTIKNYM